MRDPPTTTLDNVTGVTLRMLNVIIVNVLVTFVLSAAVADVLIITPRGTPLPSIQRAAEELTYE